MLAELTQVSEQEAYNCRFYAIKRDWADNAWSTRYFCGEVFEGHAVTPEQFQRLTELGAPFSNEIGAAMFSYGAGLVLASYLLAYGAGLLLRAIRFL